MWGFFAPPADLMCGSPPDADEDGDNGLLVRRSLARSLPLPALHPLPAFLSRQVGTLSPLLSTPLPSPTPTRPLARSFGSHFISARVRVCVAVEKVG